MVQVLCVNCRAGSPAGEGNAPIPCRTCGALLPPPGTRTWWMSRGDASFGPYTFAELVSYVGDGRVLPDDFVWHDGAPVRAAVSQLPPLAQAVRGAAPAAQPAAAAPYAATPAYSPAASAAAAVPAGPNFADYARRHATRALNWDLSTVPVEPDEENLLIAKGVDEADARRYLVWRRSVLLLVTIPTLISAVLATLTFVGQDRSGYSGLGLLLELGRLGTLFALPATAWLAAKCWDNHRRSRTILLRGWLVAFLGPLFLALFPFSWRVDFGSGDPTMISQASALIGLLGAISVYVTLMPAVLSLIPGVMRACLRIKTLIPESILPGFFLIAATPFYILLFLVIFTTINQVAGDMLLILAVLCLLGAPALYLLNAGTFTKPLRTPEEIAKIGSVQKTAAIVVGVGLILLVLYAFSGSIMGKALVGTSEATSLLRPWSLSVIQFPIEYIVRSLFTTALVADLIMLMNLSLWRHSQAFQSTAEAQSYDRLMSEIEEAGGKQLTPTEIVPKANA